MLSLAAGLAGRSGEPREWVVLPWGALFFGALSYETSPDALRSTAGIVGLLAGLFVPRGIRCTVPRGEVVLSAVLIFLTFGVGYALRSFVLVSLSTLALTGGVITSEILAAEPFLVTSPAQAFAAFELAAVLVGGLGLPLYGAAAALSGGVLAYAETRKRAYLQEGLIVATPLSLSALFWQF